ncbi:LacI family DNA-binding transcriptional regulator [Streptomyces leeuwenhoekii]|uniref:HTH-type transcriptional repressor purR n=3 Tax=Streptomyces leeuwenhoekii TaxID=1437453 RepID=A0A0F7W431_STRLW|nr:LacI family DNA-binding transcriptional regulator [Streptomyces leeuwenhoekii]CQR63771.1 HTH-type transcriptional repressor purR [Streptomyces leeuwenhoekii]
MVRITDVARRAGVSPSTVSYALSGKRPISAATRRRVEAAARELGYRPRGEARPVAGGRTDVIALVLSSSADVRAPAVRECVASAVTTARAHGRDVLLVSREGDADGTDGLRHAADAALADALIVTDVRARDPRLPLLRALDRPCVLIGVPAEPDGLTCVDVDEEAAGALCVDHLAGLGHRAVALVGPPSRGPAGRAARGVAAAAARAGLACSAYSCEAAPDAARATAGRLLRARPAPTAVVVHGERLVEPLVGAFGRLGLRVPGDLSVVALGPDPPAGAGGTPVASATPATPVTTVTVPSGTRGGRAVELLVRRLAGEPVPGVTLLPPRLTRGATTAPPGGGPHRPPGQPSPQVRPSR